MSTKLKPVNCSGNNSVNSSANQSKDKPGMLYRIYSSTVVTTAASALLTPAVYVHTAVTKNMRLAHIVQNAKLLKLSLEPLVLIADELTAQGKGRFAQVCKQTYQIIKRVLFNHIQLPRYYEDKEDVEAGYNRAIQETQKAGGVRFREGLNFNVSIHQENDERFSRELVESRKLYGQLQSSSRIITGNPMRDGAFNYKPSKLNTNN